MRRAVDTNVLIYAHMPILAPHAEVRAFLLGQLADPEFVLAITPMILHEFVHVITDARRFDPPVSMPEAVALARHYIARGNVECLSVDELVLVETLNLIERHNLGRKRIADTLLVATLLSNNVSELITCDLQDFVVFEELKLIDPRKA